MEREWFEADTVNLGKVSPHQLHKLDMEFQVPLSQLLRHVDLILVLRTAWGRDHVHWHDPEEHHLCVQFFAHVFKLVKDPGREELRVMLVDVEKAVGRTETIERLVDPPEFDNRMRVNKCRTEMKNVS